MRRALILSLSVIATAEDDSRLYYRGPPPDEEPCDDDPRFSHFKMNAFDLLSVRQGFNLMSLQSHRRVREIMEQSSSCCAHCEIISFLGNICGGVLAHKDKADRAIVAMLAFLTSAGLTKHPNFGRSVLGCIGVNCSD